MNYIDLSVPINEQTPVYPGDPPLKITPAGFLEKDGYQDHLLYIGTHVGTHIDAPAHMVKGGKALDEFPIDKFVGKGVYIKVDGKFDLEVIKQAPIEEGDIVLFHTSMSDKYYQPEYFKNYPSLSEEVANYLVGKKVKMVGMDICSPDSSSSTKIHRIFLQNDILIVENLTNLSELAGKQFRVYALPLKLEVDGAPARVIAEMLKL